MSYDMYINDYTMDNRKCNIKNISANFQFNEDDKLKQKLTSSYQSIMHINTPYHFWQNTIHLVQMQEIYNKFKKSHPSYEIPQQIQNSTYKLPNITYENKKYKYCKTCKNWISIDNFNKKKKTYDNLSKKCNKHNKIILSSTTSN